MDSPQLHMFMFPLMAHGHTIPMIDMAKLFASRGVKITIVTTPLNSISISKSILNFTSQIHLLILKFPSAEAGLPDSYENFDQIITPALVPKFLSALNLMQIPFEDAVSQHRPHCIVADMYFPWANAAAAKFGIPRLTFHGTGFFSSSASEFIRIHQPYNRVSSDTEPFLIPYLPGEISFTKMKLPEFLREDLKDDASEFVKRAHEAGAESYGVIMNSFYELEAEYADCYRNMLVRKAWHIGPLSLWNKEKAHRGSEFAIDEHECLKWLDSKKPNSVVYVCFGSMANFNSDQLKEIANGLEASGRNFIWVVRKVKGEDEEDEDEVQDSVLEGFEQRMEGKGLIVRGWAPQVLILDHPAVGGFVTHCGWNSTLEGVAAGVSMVTWPVSGEQFYNEKLVTEVLKNGVPVGVQKWVRTLGDFIGRGDVEKAIRRIMEGEEAEEIRNRAKELREMAKRAVAENGSSYTDLDALIMELKSMAS